VASPMEQIPSWQERTSASDLTEHKKASFNLIFDLFTVVARKLSFFSPHRRKVSQVHVSSMQAMFKRWKPFTGRYRVEPL